MSIQADKKFRMVEWVANIVLFILISFIFYISIPIKTTSTIFIPQGSVNNIITQLSKRGYSLGTIDKYILVILGKPQSGWINIGETHLNRIDFLHKLVTAKAKMVKITLIPGETTIIFFEEISKQLNLDVDKLQKYMDEFASYKEAGIYANTYYVPFGIKERHLIRFLVSQTDREYREFSYKVYGRYNKKKWNHILTIASIIQKEAANTKEMPIVSSVIYNRLRKKMPLQMDGSLNYGKFSHVKVTSERIKTDKTPFNTYRHKGVPPYPVSSVSFSAIKAAIKPATTNYLYFMKNSRGTHNFSRSFLQHRKNIKNSKL